LGGPEAVWVSDPAPDGSPRVVSLRFRGGAIRIDEYDGRFDLTFVKTAGDITYLEVKGGMAIWVNGQHQISYVDRLGVIQPATLRLAGPTLLWQNGQVAYRIEGLPTSADAIAVAESVAS
jgi:hypothetical protein